MDKGFRSAIAAKEKYRQELVKTLEDQYANEHNARARVKLLALLGVAALGYVTFDYTVAPMLQSFQGLQKAAARLSKRKGREQLFEEMGQQLAKGDKVIIGAKPEAAPAESSPSANAEALALPPPLAPTGEHRPNFDEGPLPARFHEHRAQYSSTPPPGSYVEPNERQARVAREAPTPRGRGPASARENPSYRAPFPGEARRLQADLSRRRAPASVGLYQRVVQPPAALAQANPKEFPDLATKGQ